jgi:hypothetical protein
VKIYRHSLEERVLIVKTYWITGSIKNFQIGQNSRIWASENPHELAEAPLHAQDLVMKHGSTYQDMKTHKIPGSGRPKTHTRLPNHRSTHLV